MVEYRNVLATKLKNIWEDSEENKRETWNKVADYVLDNFTSNDAMCNETTFDLLASRMQIYRESDVDKLNAEISRLKEIEKLWNEKNDQSWQDKAMEYLDKKSPEELKNNIKEFAEIVDKPQRIDVVRSLHDYSTVSQIKVLTEKIDEIIHIINEKLL